MNRIKATVEKELSIGIKEFLSEAKDDLRRIYNEVIQEYYSDYSPRYYDRNYSLYSLLELQYSDKGSGTLGWVFDTDQATPFERGGGSDGLFEHAFRYGWHGGAAGEDASGDSVSVPHYRTPYSIYKHWGDEAEQSRPPYDVWQERVREYERGEGSVKLHNILQERIRNIRL